MGTPSTVPSTLDSKFFLTIAVTTATTCGLLDLIWHLVDQRPGLEDSRFWSLPLATLTLTCFFAYGLAVFGAYCGTRLFARRGRADLLAIAISIAMVLTLFLISTGGVFGDGLVIETPLLLLAYLGLAPCFVLGGYFTAERVDRQIRNIAWARRFFFLLFAAPFVLYMAFGVLLNRIHNSSGLLYSSLWVVFFVLATLLLLGLYWKSTSAARAAAAVALLLWIALGPLWASWRGGAWPGPLADGAKTSRSHRVPYVLLLTVDTLRADHLGCYGAPDSPTPNIDQLAKEGILFERSLSPAPWTLPAFASIMTGVSPSLHKMSIRKHSLPGAFVTLAEHMRDADYQTAGLGRNVHLKEYSRLSRGFDQYNIYPKSALSGALGTRLFKGLRPGGLAVDASTQDLTAMAKSWLSNHAEHDFFFWLHYFDPHVPYAPPGVPLTESFSEVSAVRGGFLAPDEQQKEWIHELYKKELRHTDDNIGQVMAELKRLGIYDQTLIVFTSDHGEEFWEHGGFEHGHSLYDELLRVPLIVKLPSMLESSVGETRIVESAVSTEGILATILELCGIAFSGDYSPSGSLRRFWDGANPADEIVAEPVISTNLHYYEDKIAVSFGQYKYIRPISGQGEELYDLAADPLEQQSIIDDRPELVEEAKRLLMAHGDRARHWASVLKVDNTAADGPDAQASEELKSLGYIN